MKDKFSKMRKRKGKQSERTFIKGELNYWVGVLPQAQLNEQTIRYQQEMGEAISD